MIIKGGLNLNNRRNKFKYLYALVFFISIAIIVLFVKQTGNINLSIGNDDIVNYECQWRVSKDEGKETSINHTVDDKMIDNRFIFFRSSNKKVKVYVNDEEIYEHGDDAVLFPLSEWTWHVVEVKKEYFGKELRIVSNVHEIDNIYLSKDKSDILGRVILNEMPSIVVSIVLIFISVMLIFVWLLTKNILKSNKVLYLFILSFLVSIGFIINTRIIRLIVENYDLLNGISCEIIMLIPMAIILHYLGDEDNRLPVIVEILPIVNFIVCNFLYLRGTLNFLQVLSITNGFLIVEAVIFSVNYLYRIIIRQEKERKKADIGFIIMGGFIIFDIVKYNFIESSDYFTISRIGILFYITTLAYDVLVEILQLFIVGKNAEIYRQLAYNDILTGLLNRFAFEEDMEKINKFHYKYKDTLLIMIDINNLKFVNDTMGHEEGDKYIIRNIKYIQEKVKSRGCIYRIGGDEFAIIALKQDMQELQEIFKDMENEMIKDSKKINFAYGFAAFDESLDENIHDTLKRADKVMYNKKNRIKMEEQFL